MRRKVLAGYLLVVTAASLGMVYLDAAGIFIYFGYVPVALIVLFSVGLGLYMAGRVGQLTSRERSGFGVATLLLVFVSLASTFLPTSGRKGFFLAAKSLRPGMSLRTAQEKMRDYEVFSKPYSSVTFSFRSGPDTVDTAVVHLTLDGKYIDSVEYSPD